MKTQLFAELAALVAARLNCIASGNSEWQAKHETKILELVKDWMPRGSGVDRGTEIDLEASHAEKLVFTFSYHHMNENGMYDGWTEHKAIVTPSLQFDFNLTITGPDKNYIKEYLHDLYQADLASGDFLKSLAI